MFIQDINQFMAFFTQAVMYASALFYSERIIPPAAWTVMRFNPVLLAIELARDVALWHQPLNLVRLGYLYAFGLAACYLGYYAFGRMKPAFADVL